MQKSGFPYLFNFKCARKENRLLLTKPQTDILPSHLILALDAHTESLNLTPFRVSCIGIGLHFPIAQLPGFQRLASIRNHHRLGRAYLTRFPQVRLPRLEQRLAAGHQYLISFLSDRFIRQNLPTEMRFTIVDSKGIFQSLAFQSVHIYSCLCMKSCKGKQHDQ